MAIKTIFLDRDGVINKDVHYLNKIENFEFIEGVFDACIYFHSLNYKIIIVTNQSGITRGFLSEQDYQKINKWMLNQFSKRDISILDTFHCPHGPNANCNCRKPKPGMFIEAKKKYNINMDSSWMIGDKETDIKAANLAGINNTILVRSGHKIEESNSNSNFIIDSISQSLKIIKN
jgi:D-glycero-D-manno-heptose 1,7-bisphosphate phosphatase